MNARQKLRNVPFIDPLCNAESYHDGFWKKEVTEVDCRKKVQITAEMCQKVK